MDEHCVSRQNKRNPLQSKAGRKARMEQLPAQNDAYEEEERLLYFAGITEWYAL